MSLQGKTALVTGGARRVGRAISEGLAAQGAAVVINYHGAATEAEQLRNALAKNGTHVSAFRADVSKKADVDALMKHVQNEFGRLDVVVNNAATFERAAFADITEAMWDHVLAVNLKAPFLVSQAAASLLKKQGGSIINIADLSAFQPWPSYAHHSVSKAGLVQLTKVMARALAPEIRVNAIAPGTVLPPEDYDGTAGDGTSDRRVVTPAGTPQDVVNAIMYLLNAEFVTGQVLVVDGGRTLL